jgi:hypothetical protein
MYFTYNLVCFFTHTHSLPSPVLTFAHISMYISMYILVCILHKPAQVRARAHTHARTNTHAKRTHRHTHTDTHTHTHLEEDAVCMYVCMCVCVYVCMGVPCVCLVCTLRKTRTIRWLMTCDACMCVPCVYLEEDADDTLVDDLQVCMHVRVYVCMHYHGCAVGVPYVYLKEDADDTLVDDLQVIHAPVHQQ